MGVFSRLKGKDGTKSKTKNGCLDNLTDQLPSEPRWEDAWARTTVEPEEIQDLVRRCTEYLKSRALDLPFLLLPFRPTSDPSAVRTFIRHFFSSGNPTLRGDALAQELRMTEPMVLCGVLKWCWSRLAGGVVGWDAYELFKVGESDSNMARDSFNTFIPLSVDNQARSQIIFHFFDLMSAVAAHGKMNGFGGRKLSRMAGWWAFEHIETGNGFEGGYKAWLAAADATSHLFFAYLRSLSPDQQTRAAISLLPMSLQKLLQETEYPPQRPSLLQSSTWKVVMIVDAVSPTPFALLRRANHFQYREQDRALREWSDYQDPVQALTEECRRVLRAISAANQSQAASSSKHSTSLRDASWSRFEDIGFASSLEDEDDYEEARLASKRSPALRTTPANGASHARPMTPSWADFLSSGFVDDGKNGPAHLLPPDKVLPPIETAIRQRTAQSHSPRLEGDQNLEPGELASISRFDLDEAFWWVWMTSLSPEETPDRKSAFGRCAVVETVIRTGRWLVMEEMVQGAAPEPEEGAYIAEKKGLFSWTRRNKGMPRRKSTGKRTVNKPENGDLKASATMGLGKGSLGPEHRAKIQQAAAELQARQLQEQLEQQAARQPPQRRGRTDADLIAEKTKSVMTLQPAIVKEASHAAKWAKNYDKEAIREAYLGNINAGRGLADSMTHSNEYGSVPDDDFVSEAPPKSPPLAQTHPKQALTKSSTVPGHPLQQHNPEEDLTSMEKSLESSGLLQPPDRRAQMAGHASPTPPLNDLESTESAREKKIPPTSKKQEKPSKKLRKEKTGGGGFRKLFGRNKSLKSDAPGQVGNQLMAIGVQREKTAMHAEDSPRPSAVSIRPDTPDTPATLASTPSADAEGTYGPPEKDDMYRVDTADVREAKKEFSRFDQGPLSDQPASLPGEDQESEDDATPPPIARHPTRSPSSSPRLAQGEGETTPKALPALDRWAQIRKNAAERAAAQRRSEDQKSKATDDADDTSTEETLDARVARIKARVAELTGNMEGVSGPSPPAATPYR